MPITVVPLSLSTSYATATGVALAQTATGAVNLTLAGSLTASGVATFDVARRVILTSGGNDSGITFTIYGTDRQGFEQTEVVTGANAGAAQSTKDFKTVTRVATSAATASQVTVGTNAVGSSGWVPFDVFSHGREVELQVKTSGSPNYTVELTDDDIWDATASRVITTFSATATALIAATSTARGAEARVAQAVRVTQNSGSGTSTLTVIQQGGYL
jgi:hypothetical protein